MTSLDDMLAAQARALADRKASEERMRAAAERRRERTGEAPQAEPEPLEMPPIWIEDTERPPWRDSIRASVAARPSRWGHARCVAFVERYCSTIWR